MTLGTQSIQPGVVDTNLYLGTSPGKSGPERTPDNSFSMTYPLPTEPVSPNWLTRHPLIRKLVPDSADTGGDTGSVEAPTPDFVTSLDKDGAIQRFCNANPGQPAVIFDKTGKVYVFIHVAPQDREGMASTILKNTFQTGYRIDKLMELSEVAFVDPKKKWGINVLKDYGMRAPAVFSYTEQPATTTTPLKIKWDLVKGKTNAETEKLWQDWLSEPQNKAVLKNIFPNKDDEDIQDYIDDIDAGTVIGLSGETLYDPQTGWIRFSQRAVVGNESLSNAITGMTAVQNILAASAVKSIYQTMDWMDKAGGKGESVDVGRILINGKQKESFKTAE